MAWEEISTRSNVIRVDNYGPKWFSVPCVAIIQGGLKFNTQFLKMFGFEDTTHIRVFFDIDKEKVGIRKCEKEEATKGAFRLVIPKKKPDTEKTAYVCSKKLRTKCHKYLGKAYQAVYNAEERIVEASLNQEGL